jgi:hypothetical protein
LAESAVLALGVTQTVGHGTHHCAFGVMVASIAAERGVGTDVLFGVFTLALLTGGLVTSPSSPRNRRNPCRILKQDGGLARGAGVAVELAGINAVRSACTEPWCRRLHPAAGCLVFSSAEPAGGP